MGVWLLGQCDLYPPAASAAQTTFSNVFPETKQKEALLFCKNEVFLYFKDNLFEQTAKTMSEPNVTSTEDMENKYNLVISGTLQALKHFISSVQKIDDENLCDHLNSIVAENKFWKFSKSKEVIIRGSWYSLVSSLCQLKPVVFKEMEKKLATTVFSCLSESDPMVAPNVWECALSVVVHVENCWQNLDIQKVVLPQLWTLLKDGGRGNARVLFPCLLPFLSKLPEEVFESESFLFQFFGCFRQSLMLESVKMSSIECEAILKAFFECLQFICCTRLVEKNFGPELLESVLISEVIPLLESSLYDKQCDHLRTSNLYGLIGVFIKRMESLCRDSNCTRNEDFSRILKAFWSEILKVAGALFDRKTTIALDAPSVLVNLNFFLYNVLHAADSKLKQKKKGSVKFKDDVHDTDTSKNSPNPESPTPEVESTETDIPEIAQSSSVSFPFLVKFYEIVCDACTEKNSACFFHSLYHGLQSANSIDLALGLVKKMADRHGFEPDSVFCFVNTVVSKWIEKSDSETLQTIFSIVFLFCRYVVDEEAVKILDCCCKGNVSNAECILSVGFSLYSSFPFFQKWFKAFNWHNVVLDNLKKLILKEELQDENEFHLYHSIFYSCLSIKNKSPELLVEDDVFKTLVDHLTLLTRKITEDKFSNTKSTLSFIKKLLVLIMVHPQVCWKFNATEELIYLLFEASLCEKIEMTDMCEVFDESIKSYLKVKDQVVTENSLICKIAAKINHALLSLDTQIAAMSLLKHFIKFLSSLENHLSDHKPELNSTYFVSYKVMDIILPSTDSWNTLKKGLSINILPYYLKNKLFNPLPLNEKFSYSEEQTKKLYLAASTVCNILCSDVMLTCNEQGDAEKRVKFFSHYFKEHMPHVVWCLAFFDGIRKVGQSEEEKPSKKLGNLCRNVLSTLPGCVVSELNQRLFELALEQNVWAVCLQTLNEIHPSDYLESIADDRLNDLLNVEKDPETNNCVIRQVLIFNLPYKKKLYHLERLSEELAEVDVSTKNLNYKLAELCCFFQDAELLSRVYAESSLKVLLHKMFSNNLVSKDDLLSARNLLMLSVLSCRSVCNISIFTELSWNFLTELLTNLLKACQSVSFDTPKDALLLHETVVLFSSLCELVQDYEFSPSNLVWKPTAISSENYDAMIKLFLHVSAVFESKKCVPEMCDIALTELLYAVECIPSQHLFDTLVRKHYENRQAQKVMKQLVDSLASPVRQIQFAAYTLLHKFIPAIPELLATEQNDLPKSDEEADDEEIEKLPTILDSLVKMLTFLSEIVESMLSDILIGEPVTFVPYTDAYHMALGYLLAWIEVLDFIAASPSQIRLGYASHLEDIKLLNSLFSNAFRMMPENPMSCLKRKTKVDSPKKEDLKLLFLNRPTFTSNDPCNEEVQTLACYVFTSTLRTVPASIRTWWNNLDRKSADVINDFTTKYISGILCLAEIQAVHDNEKMFQNLQVQTRPGSREVIATYTIDECNIELSIRLPPNYPLAPIAAERRGRVVVGQLEWRNWLMQLIQVLTYQNGSILDGLQLWVRNVGKKFEGVEECMICYYILHSTKLKLPRLSCHVCKKKFHSDCLYKWFNTSNNSTCPLCRNEFKM